MERTLEEFRGFISCLDRAKEMGIIFGVGAWSMGDIKGMPMMKEAFEMGRGI
jgi:hypothetical protein